MRSPHWPLFDLRITTPRLELRPPSDEDLADLAVLAAVGVHDPDFMPFSIPWTEGGPEVAARNVLQFNWRLRAEWKPDDWHLNLVTTVDGEVVGNQGIAAKRFSAVRSVNTGSWIGLRHQGQGIGKEMRAAVLHFAFAGLDALEALSGAWDDNKPSLGVSAALGYEENGEHLAPRLEGSGRLLDLRLRRTVWEQRRRDDICIEGLDGCRAEFGLT
jgi:RimJ/RimL family protein N-acetyltransferase